MREGSGEKGLPQVGFCNVKTHPHWWCIFLNVEPHLNKNSEKNLMKNKMPHWTGNLTSCSCSLFTDIVSIDQGTNCLQRAEGVILHIVLTTAGIPDQVAVLLTSQDICCGALKQKEIKNLSAAAERNIYIKKNYLYSSTPVMTDHHTPEISLGLQMIISHTSGIAVPIISQAFFPIDRK